MCGLGTSSTTERRVVVAAIGKAVTQRGVPGHIRSDNGPEFIAGAIREWLTEKGVKTLYIEPGSPWENGYAESFHSKLRDELLGREEFSSVGGEGAERRVAAGVQRAATTQFAGVSDTGGVREEVFALRCHDVTDGIGGRP
jgi:transposase InsO family protein